MIAWTEECGVQTLLTCGATDHCVRIFVPLQVADQSLTAQAPRCALHLNVQCGHIHCRCVVVRYIHVVW